VSLQPPVEVKPLAAEILLSPASRTVMFLELQVQCGLGLRRAGKWVAAPARGPSWRLTGTGLERQHNGRKLE